MYYKYFSVGLESLKEGLTLAIVAYNDDGSILAGYNPKSLFKAKEITKEQYDSYMERFRDPAEPRGIPAGGLLNDKGKAALAKWKEEYAEQVIAENETQIALSVKKIKKLLQLEIIDQEDVDTEIEQQGMSRFKDEIKKRLEEN